MKKIFSFFMLIGWTVAVGCGASSTNDSPAPSEIKSSPSISVSPSKDSFTTSAPIHTPSQTITTQSSIASSTPEYSPTTSAVETTSSIPTVTPESPQGTQDQANNISYQTDIYYIVSADSKFLGYINNNKYDVNSICDNYGQFGSKYNSMSIWNKYGNYGGTYGTNSAYNSLSQTPPIIFKNDSPLAFLSKNNLKSPVLDPDTLLGWLVSDGCSISR